MPTYEYRCGACGHRFDAFQKISDAPIRACPECGKEAVERLISGGGGLVFKGSGFYATDYRRGGPGDGDAKGDSTAGAKETGGGEPGSGASGGKESGGKESGRGSGGSTTRDSSSPGAGE